MKIDDLMNEKKKLIEMLKVLDLKISNEFKINGISQLYLNLVKKKLIIKDDLKKVNNSIVKLIIVRDSFVFGSPL